MPPARCSSTNCASGSPRRADMDLRFSDEDEAFRREVRDWLETNLTGDFAEARGLGGPGREENEGFEIRLAWERQRFLPSIVDASELWCQGYSEPDAGSDLANLKTVAVRDGDEWAITGQKVWTSLAHWADWIFVLCRTDREAPRHRGISYLLCPMRQPGVDVRPIVQLTGTSEFSEVFFDGARTGREHVVGEIDAGWRVAMGTLAF